MGQALETARQQVEQQRQLQAQRQPASPIANLMSVGMRILMLFMLFQVASRFFLPAPPPAAEVALLAKARKCAFNGGDRYKLMVFTSYQHDFDANMSQLLWEQKGLTYDWNQKNERSINFTMPVTPELLANNTLWVHIFAIKGKSNPRNGTHLNQIHTIYPLTKYLPKPKIASKKNLITGESLAHQQQAPEAPVEEQQVNETEVAPEKYFLFWKPQLEIRILNDAWGTPPAALPTYFLEHIHTDPELGFFWPALIVNEFWLKHEALIAVNDTLSTLPLQAQFSPISFFKLSMVMQTEQSMRQQMALTGGIVEQEMDEFKRVLVETNPWFLGLTMLVSTVHMVFDFLAFKNDISFWKSRKSMAGLSVKALMMGAVMQMIIFLYLLDNETSWMILGSSGIGLLIDLWKISKAVKVSFVKKWGFMPWVKLTDRESYTKSNTKAYDEKAMKYLSYFLYPIVVGYAIYSLLYENHKSWYSWVIGSLTGAVYMFGFIMMTPQLFINYKLKSVAHLPWRALVYKSLNTFMDDLFAFIIKMPTMHRLACFRDDIVFIIYVYQRWIYPVDKTRLESLQWEDANDAAVEQSEAKIDAGAAAETTSKKDN